MSDFSSCCAFGIECPGGQDALADSLGSSRRVVLHPTFDAAQMAKAGSLSIGVEHLTPELLVSSLWDLWGDARRMVNPRYRLMKVRSLLGKHGLQESLGTARAIANLACSSSAILFADELSPDVESAVGRIIEEGGWRSRVMSLLLEYARSCNAAGQIEPGAAARLLMPHIERMDIRVSRDCLLGEPYAGLFANASNIVFEQRGNAVEEALTRIREAGGVKLLAPSGPEVAPSMAAERVIGLLANDPGASVVVYTNQAARVMEALRSVTAPAYGIAVVDSAPVGCTLVGQAVWSACQVWKASAGSSPAGSAALACAVDFALSPYSKIGSFDASELASQAWRDSQRAFDASHLDALWRADRTLTASDYACDLRKVSKTFEALFELFEAGCGFAGEGKLAAAMQALRRVAVKEPLGSPFEMAACNRLESDLMAALSVGLSPCETLEATMESSVASKRVVGDPGSGTPSVTVAALHDGAAMGKGTFDHAILADVSDSAFNSKDAPDPLRSLASALGLMEPPSAAERARASFAAAVESASISLTCMMAMHDSDSKEAFPSFCFDELGLGSIDADAERKGEDDMLASVGSSLGVPSCVEVLPRARRGLLGGCELPSHLPAVACGDSAATVMSPSAMESYLACPYRWFIERVVSPEDLDEGFGPLEAGSFAHLVLERFYGLLFERTGRKRPNAEDAEVMEGMLNEAFDAALAEQRRMRPLSGRYVPIGHIEGMAVERLRRDILRSLICQLELPDGFEPHAMELAIEPDPSKDDACPPVTYAGFALRGRVDRMDAEPASAGNGTGAGAGAHEVGRFYVLDYKGSVRGHEAGSETVRHQGLPRYVQTLIYAQALRRLLASWQGEPECVGALYTSYRAREGMPLSVGSWASGCPELAGASDAKSRVDGSFADFLDEIEHACESKLGGILRSEIPATPAFSDSCAYCPFEKGGRCSL